jgi:N-acetylneuraminic acid mutarotase
MVIWGGYYYGGSNYYLNTGGKYNPGTDSWADTSLANAPTGRDFQTAVWTGSEMIVWGGYDGNGTVNTGGRYHPDTDSWAATSNTNAPTARTIPTSVWTGDQMIVWGGAFSFVPGTDTGGRYCAQAGPTPTPSPTPTPTPCIGRCGPTPRPHPTPHVRPTPR